MTDRLRFGESLDEERDELVESVALFTDECDDKYSKI